MSAVFSSPFPDFDAGLDGSPDRQIAQLRDSLGALSMQIDEAVRARRTSTDTTEITRRVVALSHCAREHQLFLTGLGITIPLHFDRKRVAFYFTQLF